jgi:hypothetical protein
MLNYGYLRELFEACLAIEYRHVEEGGSFATLRDGDKLWIFFEKSNGAEDWMNNLSYHAVSRGRFGDEWYCHEGFLRVFESILPRIERLIRSRSVGGVVTVGYSHGAALALLCHEYVYAERADIRGNIFGFGFGCPRVVWGTVPREGERWRDFYMVRNIGDAVTHLPPRAFGYRHVGNMIEIGRSGKYGGFDAHRAENYIAELENAAKAPKED